MSKTGWTINQQTLERIIGITSDPDSKITDLLKDESLKTAIRRQVSDVINYLKKNVGNLVDVALGVIPAPYPIKRTACEILKFDNNFRQLQQSFQSNPEFFNHIISFLTSKEDFDENNGSCFTSIMESYIKNDPQILYKFPQREMFLPALIGQIQHLCITNFVEILTCDTRKSMWNYLENMHIERVLFNAFGTVDYLNERILNYMRNIVCSTDMGSPVLDMFTEPACISKLFDFGYNGTTHVSAAAFRVIYEVLGLVIYEDENEREDNILFGTIFKETAENLEALCEFAAQQNKPFLEDKFRAIELITAIMTVYPEPEQCIYDLMKVLFDEFFRYPTHTFLHESFYNLFLKVSKGAPSLQPLVDQLQMYSKIMEGFDGKDCKLCSYIGHLYQMSNIIYKKLGEDPSNTEWNDFYKKEIEGMKDVISVPFGGLLPNQGYRDDTDSDDDLSAREAAIQIFGKAFFYGNDEEEDNEGIEEEEEEEESSDFDL